jgi:very-short-patch-repair endonuclease
MIRRDAFFPYRRSLKRRSQSLRRDPSPAERKLWYEFLRGLPDKFTRQKPLVHYVVDFYCSRQRLVVEVDGDSHFTEEAMGRDATRTAALEAIGVRVLRLTNQEVMQDFEGACGKVLDALSR